MRLEIGMIVAPSYSPDCRYKITNIKRNCVCPGFGPFGEEPVGPRKPHLHITCKDLNGIGEVYLNGYEEKTLKSLDTSYCGKKDRPGYDYILIIDENKAQMTLF